MKIISHGKDNPPDMNDKNIVGDCLFVDMWGNWSLYKREYTRTFDALVERFIEDRKRQTSYFNNNYIRRIIINDSQY